MPGVESEPNDEKNKPAKDDVTKIVLPANAEPERYVAESLSNLEDTELVGGPGPQDSSYDEDDEAMIRSRLEALGYL